MSKWQFHDACKSVLGWQVLHRARQISFLNCCIPDSTHMLKLPPTATKRCGILVPLPLVKTCSTTSGSFSWQCVETVVLKSGVENSSKAAITNLVCNSWMHDRLKKQDRAIILGAQHNATERDEERNPKSAFVRWSPGCATRTCEDSSTLLFYICHTCTTSRKGICDTVRHSPCALKLATMMSSPCNMSQMAPFTTVCSIADCSVCSGQHTQVASHKFTLYASYGIRSEWVSEWVVNEILQLIRVTVAQADCRHHFRAFSALTGDHFWLWPSLLCTAIEKGIDDVVQYLFLSVCFTCMFSVQCSDNCHYWHIPV